MIPGLERAEVIRYGMMHRNTYVNAPEMLHPTMQYRRRSDLLFAGQITGAEGYMGNAATGLVAGLNAARMAQGHYITHADARTFQPMKANFGLLPAPEHRLAKADRYRHYADRSLTSLRRFARERGIAYDPAAAAAPNTEEQVANLH
jgi:methylenetetrahydrofolate--tRNA-(uracil-5-)-methyltransferase